MRKRYTKKVYTRKVYTKKGYTKKRYTKKRQNNKVQYRLSKIKKQNYYLVGGGLLPSPLEYWNSVFTASEITKLYDLKNMLQTSMSSEPTSSSPKKNSICELMMELVPTYYIPDDVADQPVRKTNRDGETTNWKAADFYRYYTTLCAAFLLFGIIAHKINSYAVCNYKLILKGGKAIQVVLREIFEEKKASSFATTILGSLHQTQDIDVLLLPKEGKTYDRTEIEELSSNISELIKWFLTTSTTNISKLEPTTSNPNIHKLSVEFPDGFVAFSDIDFGKVPKPEFYAKLQKVEPDSSKAKTIILDLPVLFECPSIGTLLDEKIYYYGEYSKKKDEATIKGDNASIASCDYFLAKFKKAIISLNNGIQLSKTDPLDAVALENACRKHLKNILNRKFKYDWERIKGIIAGIYSDPKEQQSRVPETSLTHRPIPINTTIDPTIDPTIDQSRPVDNFTTPECLMLAQQGTIKEWRLQHATLLSEHLQYAHGQSSQSQPASTIPIHTLLMQQLQQQQQPQQWEQYPQQWWQQQQWLQEQEQQRLQQQQLLTPEQQWWQEQLWRQELLMHQQQQSQQQQSQQQQLLAPHLLMSQQHSQQPRSRQSQQQQPRSQQYRVLNKEEQLRIQRENKDKAAAAAAAVAAAAAAVAAMPAMPADEAAPRAAEQEAEQDAEHKVEQKVGHVLPAIEERRRPQSYWDRQERRQAARAAAAAAQR